MRTSVFTVATLFVWPVSGLANANCLSRASLDHGIQITFWDGSTATIRRVDGNLLEYFNSNSAVGRQHQLSYFGVYDIANDEQFDNVPPEPVIGLEIAAIVTVAPPRGPRIHELTFNFSQGAGREIDGCEYETIDIGFDEDLGNGIGVRKNGRTYIPALGFAVWSTPIASMSAMP